MKACGCGHDPKKGTHKAPSLCLTRGAASRTRRKAAAAAKHCGSDSAHHRRKCRSRKRTARRSAPSAVRLRKKSSESVAQHRRDRFCGHWSRASTDCACPEPRCPFQTIGSTTPFLPPLSQSPPFPTQLLNVGGLKGAEKRHQSCDKLLTTF